MNADELCAGLPHHPRQGMNKKNNHVTSPGKDACQGDSGGPLICSIDDQAVLVGVVSHGSGCGEEGKPGIYGKVDYFIEWFKTYLVEPALIVLTNQMQTSYALEMNFASHEMHRLDFSFGNHTEAYGACTAVYKGETYVLGGHRKINQAGFQTNALSSGSDRPI